MKEKLLKVLGKSVDITIHKGSFLDGKNSFRAALFGKLEMQDESMNCFIVRRDENSPNSVSFTADMVTYFFEVSQFHAIITIKIDG